MKDYYKILGVSENATDKDIKSAYRQMAFKHHPDKNPGNEKAAEATFKKINEAYYVLGDKERRRQYDGARRGHFAGAGYDGRQRYGYSQQDIFQGMFSGQSGFEDLNSMFAQAGLRFDRDFINRVFFSGGGFTFSSNNGAQGTGRGAYDFGGMSHYDTAGVTPNKPNFFERTAHKVNAKVGKFVLKNLFGIQIDEPVDKKKLDKHLVLRISRKEADAGCEIPINCRRNGGKTKLMVKVPAGIKTGTKIRLKAMGQTKNGQTGDLYLHIEVKG